MARSRRPAATKRRATFRLDEPDAHEVGVGGGFNEWNPGAHRMKKSASGSWSKVVVLPPGRYEYKFVADGSWRNDPGNDQILPNVHGTANSVLIVS